MRPSALCSGRASLDCKHCLIRIKISAQLLLRRKGCQSHDHTRPRFPLRHMIVSITSFGLAGPPQRSGTRGSGIDCCCVQYDAAESPILGHCLVVTSNAKRPWLRCPPDVIARFKTLAEASQVSPWGEFFRKLENYIFLGATQCRDEVDASHQRSGVPARAARWHVV